MDSADNGHHKSWLKSIGWKTWLNIITVAALIFLVVLLRKSIVETIDNFGQVHAWWLILIIPVEGFNYLSQAKLYQTLFRVLDNPIDTKFLYKVSLELNFVNTVFPTSGVSGVSYFGYRMRSDHVTGGKAAVVQLMKLVVLFMAFEVLLFIGLFILAVAGRANNVTVLIAAMLTTLVFGMSAVFVFIIGSNQRINSFLSFFTKLVNRFVKIFRPRHPEAIDIERAKGLFTELHHNYIMFQSKYKQLKMPMVWAFFCNLTEVMAVYVVYVAFGHWVNFGAVILAYAVANIAGVISVLPGGVGVYEALMTATLATTGIRAALSIPVVIMYRILNTVLQLPPGFYFYRQAMSSGKGLPTQENHA